MAEVAVGIGPFVPYAYTVFLQVVHVCVAGEEPQQFVYDRFEMQFLGCDQRKSVGEIETHLVAEHRFRARAGTVGFHGSVFEYMS